MESLHRLTAWTALALLALVALAQPGRTVTAGVDDATLGPADAVAISGSDGDLLLRNEEGRIAWGDAPSARAYSTAFVQVGRALEPLMRADHFLQARGALEEQIGESGMAIRSAMDALIEEGRDLAPDDPSIPDLRRQLEQLRGEYQEFQRDAAKERGILTGGQMRICYEEILAAVNIVAERLEIDLVLRFIPPDDPISAHAPDAVLGQIRLRSALRVPEGLDITDEVLSELGVDDG